MIHPSMWLNFFTGTLNIEEVHHTYLNILNPWFLFMLLLHSRAIILEYSLFILLLLIEITIILFVVAEFLTIFACWLMIRIFSFLRVNRWLWIWVNLFLQTFNFCLILFVLKVKIWCFVLLRLGVYSVFLQILQI